MDEPIVRLSDGLLGYAIDRVIETGTQLGGMYGNVKFLNRGEVVSSIQYPVSSIQYPVSGIQYPVSSIQYV